MAFDPYELLLLLVGVPLTLWFLLTNQTGGSENLRFALALVWFGAWATLYLLSRDHGQRTT